jgi:bifunctional DNA-binding transcriptional regulator/antitoxin component of YhaV-PrlF toxin-antitoxin module
MTTSTLSQNGQTTIPRAVRRFLRIKPRQKLLYRFSGDEVVLQAARTSTAELYGSLKSNKPRPTAAQLDALRARQARRKYAV